METSKEEKGKKHQFRNVGNKRITVFFLVSFGFCIKFEVQQILKQRKCDQVCSIESDKIESCKLQQSIYSPIQQQQEKKTVKIKIGNWSRAFEILNPIYLIVRSRRNGESFQWCNH